jgi:SMC interacting uncharacterized protein involved in chromosome segregation
MGLDFSYTCPRIDKAISEAKEIITEYTKDYILEICPYLPDHKADELSKDWGAGLYDRIADCFEAVRETNEDIRKQADFQIERLESEIENLNFEINKLEDKIDSIS